MCASVKMKTTDNILPDWIQRQASLGPNIEIDQKPKDNDAFWYLLTMCCPLIFDAYAIILHPFWVKSDEINSYQPASWTDFFNLHQREFKLETANQIQEEIRKEISKEKWPENIRYPGEGDCEDNQLIFVRDTILRTLGDQIVEYYYCILKTRAWEKEVIIEGYLSELEKLWTKDELNDNPTAIYPHTKEWCIITDFDLPFTYVGGPKQLINSLTNKVGFDIYELSPKFKERK